MYLLNWLIQMLYIYFYQYYEMSAKHQHDCLFWIFNQFIKFWIVHIIESFQIVKRQYFFIHKNKLYFSLLYLFFNGTPKWAPLMFVEIKHVEKWVVVHAGVYCYKIVKKGKIQFIKNHHKAMKYIKENCDSKYSYT